MANMMPGKNTWSLWSFSRTHAATLDPATVEQDAKAFGSAIRQYKQVVLLAMHTEAGELMTYLMSRSRGGDGGRQVASAAAHAIKAAVAPCEDLPVLGGSCIALVTQRSGSTGSRNNAAGAQPGDIAAMFASHSSPGDWAAISLAAPSSRQSDCYRRWVKMREASDSHFSSSTSLVVGSVVIGSTSPDACSSLADLVMGMLPGFDIETSTHVPGTGVLPWLAGAGGVAVWAGLNYAAKMPVAAAGAGSALSLVAPASVLGVLPTPRSKLAGSLATGGVPRPGRKAFSSRAESVNKQTGKEIRARLRYPLEADTFLFTPAMVVGLVAPASESGSGAVRTASRSVPTTLRSAYGPLVGHDAQRNPAHIDAGSLYEGVGTFGLPGSGKSVFLRLCMGWNIAQRVRPDEHPDSPGADNTLIVFESKGQEGADRCVAWGAAMGDQPLVVDLADASTLAIDVFDFPGTIEQRATRFVDAMEYTFTDGSVGYRASETLNAIIPGALLLSGAGHGSVMDLAHVLAGGVGDDRALAAYGDVVALCDDSSVARGVKEGMGILFGPSVTSSVRRGLCESSRNKLDQMRRINTWWDPARRRVSWSDILKRHEFVVINLGNSMNPDMPSVTSSQTALMSSLLMFTLRDAIRATCDGWRERDKVVSVFADELSLLAGNSPDVIVDLRDRMRSYGVRCYFGTQYPRQLDDQVRSSVKGFATFLWFSQNDDTVMTEAAADLAAVGHEWSQEDIGSIPLFDAAMRSSISGSRLSPCLVTVDYYEKDLSRYAREHDIDPATVPGVDRSWIPAAVVRAPVVDLSKREDAAPVSDASDPDRFSW